MNDIGITNTNTAHIVCINSRWYFYHRTENTLFFLIYSPVCFVCFVFVFFFGGGGGEGRE